MSDLFLEIEEKQDTFTEGDFLDPTLPAKELTRQVDWVITQRKSDYLKALLGLQSHSSVAVRRKVALGIGLLGNQDVLYEVQKWQVHESDRKTWLILEGTVDKLQRTLQNDSIQSDVRVLSVSEALSQIKRLVGEKTYVIEGELSEVRPVYQMYYFAIKDGEDTKLDCRCFSGIVIRSGFPLNEGLSVRLTGQFKLDNYSRLKFEVKKIELTGEGELLRNLKMLEEKLTKEGLFDVDRKRQPKKLPQSILLLASSSSAAINDFTKVLQERRGGIQIYHLPIKTQGVGAEFDLLSSLEIVNQLTERYAIDTIVITRGGGSKDDLIVFNSEKVVRAIHALNRPTIVAIGHERDVTLAELVADVRASTPSNAAELVSLSREEVRHQMNANIHWLSSYFYQKKDAYTQPTNVLFYRILQYVQRLIEIDKNLCRKTDALVSNLIFEVKIEKERVWQRMVRTIQKAVSEARGEIQKVESSHLEIENIICQKRLKLDKTSFVILSNVYARVHLIRSQFELTFQKIHLQNPKHILELGYAMIYQEDLIQTRRSIIDDSKAIKIVMYDGEIEASIS